MVAPRWVFESFRAHTLLDAGAFRLRALEGLVVCTTGLAASARAQVERLAQQHGALYDPTLEIGHTSVLVAQRAGGAKFAACVAHGVPVVHVSWLHACAESGSLLDEAEFALERVLRPSRLFSQLQEQLADVECALPSLLRRFRREHAEPEEEEEEEEEADEDDELEDEANAWMELLDSCVLHLVGFPAKTEAALQRLVRASMGTIYYDLNAAHVTHVLVSPSLRDLSALAKLEEQTALANADGRVHFVSPKWLLDSIRCLRVEPEELYPVEVDTEHETPGDTHLGDASLVDASFEQRPEVNADHDTSSQGLPPPPLEDGDADDPPNAAAAADDDDDEREARGGGLFSGCAFLLLCRDPDDRVLLKPMIKQIQSKSSAQAIALDFRDFAHLDVGQFAFLTHLVVCAGVELDAAAALQIEQQLTSLQSFGDDGDADTGGGNGSHRKRRRVTFVSDLWVNCCLAAGVKLSHQSHELFSLTLHQPRSLFQTPLPLACFAGVRASTSVYVGVDRLVVMELLRLAGAQATSKLSKRNTHLVCLKPIGMKYEKAKEWGLAIVTARWVVQSLVHGALLDAHAEEFQVRDDDGGGEDVDMERRGDADE